MSEPSSSRVGLYKALKAIEELVAQLWAQQHEKESETSEVTIPANIARHLINVDAGGSAVLYVKNGAVVGYNLNRT